MKTKLTYYIFLLLPVFFAGSMQVLLSQSDDTIRVISYNKINLCEKDDMESVQIGVSLGEVTKQDQLYGYDFQASFDTNAVKFHTALYFNTLSQYFYEENSEYYGINFDNTKGIAVGWGVTLSVNEPVYGDKPLLAFQGDYIGDCPDTTLVELDYLEFTDEFQREINGYKAAKVVSYMEPVEGNFLMFESMNDSLSFDSLESNSIKIRLSKSKQELLKKFKMIIDKPAGNFEIDTIELAKENFEVLSSNVTDNSFIYELKLNGDISDTLLAEMQVSTKDNADDTSSLTVRGDILDDCSCISKVINADVNLKSTKKNEVSVIENYSEKTKVYFISDNKEIRIESEDLRIKKINLYNSIGVKMNEFDFSGQSEITIQAGDITGGMYVCQIITDNNKIVNKFLLK